MAINDGWGWFAGPEAEPAGADPTAPEDADLARAFARCFRGADGERVLAHLRGLTIERALGPGATDALLRHAEGQRQLVFHVLALIERGRGAG